MFTFVAIPVLVFARKPLYTRAFSYRLGKKLKQLVKVTDAIMAVKIYFLITIWANVYNILEKSKEIGNYF